MVIHNRKSPGVKAIVERGRPLNNSSPPPEPPSDDTSESCQPQNGNTHSETTQENIAQSDTPPGDTTESESSNPPIITSLENESEEPTTDQRTSDVVDVVGQTASRWKCYLEWDAPRKASVFRILKPNGERSLAIRERAGEFYTHICEGDNPSLEHSDDVRECSSFNQAIATMLGAFEWGTLPPGNPEIWDYKGYTGEGNFGQYLSGTDNDSCGSHYFENTKANYAITIESYAVKNQLSTDSIETYAELAVLDTCEERGEQPVLYQRRFSGQQGAFSYLFDLLSNQLSHKLAQTSD